MVWFLTVCFKIEEQKTEQNWKTQNKIDILCAAGFY